MIKVEIEHGEVISISEFENKFKYTVMYVRDTQRLKRVTEKAPKTLMQVKVVQYGKHAEIKKGDTLYVRGYLDSDPYGYRVVAQHAKILRSKSHDLF